MPLNSDLLAQSVQVLYNNNSSNLHFHNWNHTLFVRKHALVFARELNADAHTTDIAALLHDLNYIVETNSSVKAGKELRQQLLKEADYSKEIIESVERIIKEAQTRMRRKEISQEAKALSDADTLFKALPITPILFAHRYLSENKISLAALATKIVEEQQPIYDAGFYFYTESAKLRYLKWAGTNLSLWTNVIEFINSEIFEDHLLFDSEF